MGEFWRENQVVTETGKRTYIFVIRLFYQQFISFLIWTNTFKISIWTIQGAFPSNNVMSSALKMQTRGRRRKIPTASAATKVGDRLPAGVFQK